MKIGWVAPGGFDRSGVERVIPVFLGLLKRLARQPEAHVFALRQGHRACSFTLLGATVHEMGGASLLGLPLLRRTLRAVSEEHRRGRFDVLHGLWANQSGFAAALAGRILRVPVVVTIAGGELARLPEIGYGGALSWRTRLEVRTALRLARVVTGATEFVLAPARVQRPDALHLPLGVDPDLYSPPNPAPEPPWQLLQIAHLNRVKDQPTLLRAFQNVFMDEPSARLEILGEDTLNGSLQQMAADMGLGSAVLFRGVQPVEEVARSLRRSHLLLHTSRHECGQMAYLEAAACGVAAVGTAVGYVADLAPEAAVAVPIGDHEALARETLRLLRDEESRHRVAGAARAFARAHDADWTVSRLNEIYTSIAGRHSGR